jgi:DNA-binding response OmpR family regulator
MTDVPKQISDSAQLDQRPIRIGDFYVDVLGRRIWVRGVETNFRRLEFEFMKYLSLHPDELLRRERLLESLWGRPDVSGDRLRSLILAVRNKIETTDVPRYLVTERALGYRFIPSPRRP